MSEQRKIGTLHTNAGEIAAVSRALLPGSLHVTNHTGRPLRYEVMTDGVDTFVAITEDSDGTDAPAFRTREELAAIREDARAKLDAFYGRDPEVETRCLEEPPAATALPEPRFGVNQRVRVNCPSEPLCHGRTGRAVYYTGYLDNAYAVSFDDTGDGPEQIGAFPAECLEVVPDEPPLFAVGQLVEVHGIGPDGCHELNGRRGTVAQHYTDLGLQRRRVWKYVVNLDGDDPTCNGGYFLAENLRPVQLYESSAPEPPADEPRAIAFREFL